jgi:hypothetical protein
MEDTSHLLSGKGACHGGLPSRRPDARRETIGNQSHEGLEQPDTTTEARPGFLSPCEASHTQEGD